MQTLSREASTTGNGRRGGQVAGQKYGKFPFEQYGGEQINLADATVAFSRSKKEANPFCIAETQSMENEAKERGIQVKLHCQLAILQADHDVNTLLAKGVDTTSRQKPAAQLKAPP